MCAAKKVRGSLIVNMILKWVSYPNMHVINNINTLPCAIYAALCPKREEEEDEVAKIMESPDFSAHDISGRPPWVLGSRHAL